MSRDVFVFVCLSAEKVVIAAWDEVTSGLGNPVPTYPIATHWIRT